MSKSVKKEILVSEYSSEQVLAVNTSMYWIKEYRSSLSLVILGISYILETQKLKIRIILVKFLFI